MTHGSPGGRSPPPRALRPLSIGVWRGTKQPRGTVVPGAGTWPRPRRSRLCRRPASHYLGMWLSPPYGRQILPGGGGGVRSREGGGEMGLLMAALTPVPRSGRVPRGCLQLGGVSGVWKWNVSESLCLPAAGCTPKSWVNCRGNPRECSLSSLLGADRWTGKKYR